MPLRPTGLTVRDAIHGDIFLTPLQAAVVDTPVFQRLRYIRQNGLLHFVFPGAVHTRFAHSIGTMHLARRVFQSLFPSYRPTINGKERSPLGYIGAVFELAALLHDVGHCAFSHSIERVELRGEPFFHSMRTLVEEWQMSDLTTWWKSNEYQEPKATEHEDIGILLVTVLFGSEHPLVAEACRSVLGVEPTDLARDVRALTAHQKLPPTPAFKEHAREILGDHLRVGSARDSDSDDLLGALRSLISGTLDVDRLDYLIRDSRFTGVTYGICDVNVLVNACNIIRTDLGVQLGLKARATRAVDDMLWSRYQLFTQVLNHKTNVMLNAMLAEAIPQAVDSASIHIGRPRTFVELLEFTDDFVMSSVLRECLRVKHTHRAYDRALVHRDFPVHLGTIELSGDASKDGVAEHEHTERCKRDLKPGSVVQTWRTESALMKGGGLPWVIRSNKLKGTTDYAGPNELGSYQILEWTEVGKLPAKVVLLHFFVDRERLNGQEPKNE